jgi:hypothetical protein
VRSQQYSAVDDRSERSIQVRATYCKQAIGHDDIKSQQDVGIYNSLQISVVEERFFFFNCSPVLLSPLVEVPTGEESRDQRVLLDISAQSSACSDIHRTGVKKSINRGSSGLCLKMAATEEGRRGTSVRKTDVRIVWGFEALQKYLL